MNIDNDKHMITFASNRLCGLVDIGCRRSKENTVVGREGEASSYSLTPTMELLPEASI
jgi:hypothetical protein